MSCWSYAGMQTSWLNAETINLSGLPRNRLAKQAYRIERFIDRFRPVRSRDNLTIDPYVGYGTMDGVVVHGRVLSRRQEHEGSKKPGLLANVRMMASLFMTREVSDVEVDVAGTRTRSGEEGYFSTCVPVSVAETDTKTGYLTISLPGHGYECQAPIVVSDAEAELGIISDIDDTIMQTGTFNLARNLWTTLTGSVESRRVFTDTVALIRMRQAGKNPVFYVSSSPWNLHGFLNAVFQRNDVPFGPKFLRDFGISETKFIKSSHGSHKGDAIDTIIAANPGLRFVLIGDTGQHDGQVYLEAIERHKTVIAEVCLRHAGPMDDLDANIADKIRSTGVRLFTGPSFAPLVEKSR